MANDLGFYVVLYFIVGSPYETLDDVKNSIRFANKYATGGCNFGSLMPIPDTALMEWVRENGKLLMEPDYYLNELAEYERVPYFEGAGMSLDEKKLALKITEKTRLKLSKRYKRKLKKNIFKSDAHRKGIIKAVLLQFVMLLLESKHFNRLYNGNSLMQKFGLLVKNKFRL
jgi:radical SAM superfamily enzyme YgiQ (UPF0313 family)